MNRNNWLILLLKLCSVCSDAHEQSVSFVRKKFDFRSQLHFTPIKIWDLHGKTKRHVQRQENAHETKFWKTNKNHLKGKKNESATTSQSISIYTVEHTCITDVSQN